MIMVKWQAGIYLILTILVLGCGNLSQKPNIILVFVDDMGWGDLSCFGNQDAETPNIDRLAEEGLSFEQFYVNSPICSPSRVAISTGQYPQRWDITSYLAHRKNNGEREMANWLDPRAPMLARQLKEKGYLTGHFGKWHMGGQRDVDDAPLISDYGFDASLTNFEGLGPKLLPLTLTPDDNKPGRIWEKAEILKGPVTWIQRSKITEGFVNSALYFVRAAEKSGQPFYINVWPDDVHSPFFPPVEKWGETKRDLYLAVLEEMDKQLSPLFNYIRNSETLRQNTIILFCSDNGHEPGAGHAGPLKGCKTNLYEGGIRSPLIVWGPGILGEDVAGIRNQSSVLSAMDLVPSLLNLAGIRSSSSFDGEDLHKTILGKSQNSRSSPLFFSRPPDRKNFYGYENLPDLALREGKWKLLCDYDGGRPELYDLENDIGEQENLAERNPDLVNELTEKVLAWYEVVTQ